MKPFSEFVLLCSVACVCHDFGFAHKVAPTSIGAYWSGSLTAGSVVTFSGAGSGDNDTQDGGYVPRWHWDFDYQGTFVEDVNTASSLVDHIYAQGGAYTVAVRYDDNDNQAGNVYTFGVRIYEPKRYYYLKDHLGSIRSTVKGGELLVADDFSGDMSQWTVTSGSGFVIEGGELSCSMSGANTLVNSSSKVLADGIITVDVKSVGGSSYDPNVIVRYQDPNNFYFVRPIGGAIQIYERLGGSYYNRASGPLDSAIVADRFYRLQIVAEGSTISAYWKNGTTPIVTWTDGTPWLSGKVGFFGFGGRHAHWDNITVTTGGPGQVVSAEDFDAWGQVLEGRSVNQGMNDTRYKYTGKERDVESQYDYFGARYYDSRVGRFLSVDRYANKYPSLSPFSYGACNPVRFVDINGDSLWIGQNREQSFSYLQQLHPEFANRLSLSDNGLVTFNTENLDLSTDATLELMNNLVNGGASGEFAQLQFMFEVAEVTSVSNREGGGQSVSLTDGHIENVSVTPRNANGGIGAAGFAPISGFAGQVSMPLGTWTPMSLNSVVFHELAENWHRTVNGEPYCRWGAGEGEKRLAVGGAHERAIMDAQRYSLNSGNPWIPQKYIRPK